MSVMTTGGVRGRAREAILDAASVLFYRDGIRATSVDAVAEEAGVTKRTLYHHFESKDDLVASYLERRDEPTRVSLAASATAAAGTPGDRILAVYGILGHWFETHDYRGCAFLNAVSECGSDARVRLTASAHKDATQAWFLAQLREANACDAELLSAMLMVLLDGAMARAVIYRDGAQAHTARAAAAILLQQAGVATHVRT